MQTGYIKSAGLDRVGLDFAELMAVFFDGHFALELEMIANNLLEPRQFCWLHNILGRVNDHSQITVFTDVGNVQYGRVKIDMRPGTIKRDDIQVLGVNNNTTGRTKLHACLQADYRYPEKSIT